MPDPILVVCGLNREADIARGPGIVAVAGGGHRMTLERRLEELASTPFAAVVSFGLAGALESSLRPGAVVIPWRVTGGGRSFDTARALVMRWLPAFDTPSGRPVLARSAPQLAGVDAPVLTRAEKGALALASGAGAVDMESHIAAAFAARRILPFAVLRAISDPSDRDLPPLVSRAMRPDGSVDVVGVLGSLLRGPGQIPALVSTARDAGTAFRALRRVRGLLGPRLGLHL